MTPAQPTEMPSCPRRSGHLAFSRAPRTWRRPASGPALALWRCVLLAGFACAVHREALAQQPEDSAPPVARPTEDAPPLDPSLPPPAAPSAAPPPARPNAQAAGAGPQERAEAPETGPLAGLPLNAITIRNLILQQKLELALQVADLALQRYPNDTEVRMQRARLLFWLKRPAEAEAEAVAVYQADSRNTEALRLVAQIRESRNDAAGAIRAWREAQLRGDGDVRIAARLIALYIEIDRPDLARGQIRPGMEVADELEYSMTLKERPWLAQGLLGLSLYRGDLWQRAELTGGYRWSRQLTLTAGVYGEQRNTTINTGGAAGTTVTSTAYGAYAWLFFEVLKLSGDVRLFIAPQTGGYLPPVDVWAEGAWNFGKFGLGLWARVATYEIASLWSIGPYLPIFLGRLTVTPGYLFVGRGKGPAADIADIGQVGHTFYLRTRFDFDLRDAVYAWAYVGQEVVFTNRTLSAPDESSVSLVLGWDHWFNHRFGIRLMGTALQQLKLGDRWYDLAFVARARL